MKVWVVPSVGAKKASTRSRRSRAVRAVKDGRFNVPLSLRERDRGEGDPGETLASEMIGRPQRLGQRFRWARRDFASMTVARICWYLCGLFAVALFAESAGTTFQLQSRRSMWLETGAAALSIIFRAVAFALARMRFAEPRWLLRVFQCLAALATIIVVLMFVG